MCIQSFLMPAVGLEPTRPCEQQILSLHHHDSSIITEKTKSVYNLSNEIFYSIIKGGLKRRIGGHYGLRTG